MRCRWFPILRDDHWTPPSGELADHLGEVRFELCDGDDVLTNVDDGSGARRPSHGSEYGPPPATDNWKVGGLAGARNRPPDRSSEGRSQLSDSASHASKTSSVPVLMQRSTTHSSQVGFDPR